MFQTNLVQPQSNYREEIEKRESLEKESDSLKVRLDKEGEGEGMHKVDNLKTRMKRQHSDTFILKNRIKETKLYEN